MIIKLLKQKVGRELCEETDMEWRSILLVQSRAKAECPGVSGNGNNFPLCRSQYDLTKSVICGSGSYSWKLSLELASLTLPKTL